MLSPHRIVHCKVSDQRFVLPPHFTKPFNYSRLYLEINIETYS